MSDRTSIEWTATVNADGSVTPGATWNPIRAREAVEGKVGWHCVKVSPGCTNCYAERLNRRLGTGRAYTKRAQGIPFLDEKILTAPLGWQKPRKVFVCSMTDLFGEWVSDEWIDRIFTVMAMAPQHTFQLLSKRAKRMRQWFERTASGADRETIVYESKPGFSEKGGRIYWPGWPLPNVWMGVSCEDKQRLDERVPELLKTPAAVRFVSAEPLLGPIDMRPALFRGDNPRVRMCPRCLFFSNRAEDSLCPNDGASMGPVLAIDWVIVGSESGPGRRETELGWARSIRDQCSAAGVPLFLKQLHEGGKKISLPKLDGRMWSEFPGVRP